MCSASYIEQRGRGGEFVNGTNVCISHVGHHRHSNSFDFGSSDYSRMNGTTGYSSNMGVWTRNQKMQAEQEQKQTQPIKKVATVKKRKKWKDRRKHDEKIYKIFEQDEEVADVDEDDAEDGEDNITPPPDHLNVTKSVKEPVTEPVQQIRADSNRNIPKIANTTDRCNGVVPEIVVSLSNEPPSVSYQNGAVNHVVDGTDCKSSEITRVSNLRTDTLKLPAIMKRSPTVVPPATYSLPPEPSVYSNSTLKNCDTFLDGQENCGNLDIAKYLHSPKYTHIRVPRRRMFTTHISQESLESPLRLPHLDTYKPVEKKKKVMISLSKSLPTVATTKHKKRNVVLSGDGSNLSLAVQSSGSASTRASEESRSRRHSPDSSGTNGGQNMSLETIRKHSLTGLHTINNITGHIEHVRNNYVHQNGQVTDNGRKSKVQNNDRTENECLKCVKKREKWKLPDNGPIPSSFQGRQAFI